MEKNNNGWVIGILITCLVVSVLTLYVVFGALNQPEPVSADDIAKKIVIPQPQIIDVDALVNEITSKLVVPKSNVTVSEVEYVSNDRLCELTNDCMVCFNFDYDDSELAENELADRDYRELKKAVEDITELDVNDYDEFDVRLKDSYSYADSCKEGNDGNFNTQLLYRIEYVEEDSDDSEILYVLVTLEIEDNEDVDVDEVEVVNRKFEIEKLI